ncbi:heterogeneous nuclear ribonucleoprotein R [Aplysia californica]|uniref:Heterogeneous nuclear ribonucleoprotein R n=1 Tax=Aplysia californica TaxID=6500 RepID=A0ABM0JPI0_APLCA|nr:heterogeneous nuclear ribonucleoprotein R [Aplysia californica]
MTQNGDDVDMKEQETLTAEEETEAQTLLDHGISKIVAKELLAIYKTEKLSQSDLDDRAMDALKEFAPDDAIKVLKQFCESNLEHVGNKSAFLCGQMKTYRHKLRAGNMPPLVKGPDDAKLKEILDRTGYSLDVTTGQRKYGGPPPGGDPTPPGSGHEIFCGKIPKDVFEDELIPLFEKCGKIWDMRLMMDPMTGLTRGYGFITFCEREAASEAVNQLHNYEIRPGKQLKVNVSIANVRLFVGNIPKNKSKDEIKEEFGKRTDGLVEVIVYGSADNPKQKNRGFAFLEYETHKQASNAKRKLQAGHPKFWQCDVIVDWADPMEEPDDETMSKVKVLYVRNLTSDVTEDMLKEKFGEFGKVERVKKIKDYGFVHFEERDDALKAMEGLNGQKVGSLDINISLAKPPSENKKKEQRKRDQERRLMRAAYYGFDDYWPPARGGAQRSGLRRPPYPEPFYDEYYGYDDYDYYGMPPFPPMRGGRGGRGMPPPPMRGGGGLRGHAIGGPATRGAAGRGRGAGPARGASRGGRGASNGNSPSAGSSPVAARGGKRKAGTDFTSGTSKRRNTDSWGSQPIAQQPLKQEMKQDMYGAISYDGNDGQEWYQDSYGQQWK